ncbi:hypothetical protein [Sanguibacter sp. 25GB23B1]|uniref:hypothetical protein n=1 Tax=unclassified Sanguibacter TaxID=2645534 RepID=UPI0032AF91B0
MASHSDAPCDGEADDHVSAWMHREAQLMRSSYGAVMNVHVALTRRGLVIELSDPEGRGHPAVLEVYEALGPEPVEFTVQLFAIVPTLHRWFGRVRFRRRLLWSDVVRRMDGRFEYLREGAEVHEWIRSDDLASRSGIDDLVRGDYCLPRSIPRALALPTPSYGRAH